ncbi:glycosyltransferase family 4 protein [Heyndrickxia coagulans]|uniref:glycosyltransferase family 4 protein n=1 Tax=Heyndrickxia coagulans TaxID=1398 RepID=UPI000778FED0|nr:glycosyltransferase family 1 protein [Heyndrickxia coagulans]KYC63717.1 hypothetical protein B4100_0935 [Heyndrickxia coagulans]UZH05025.1 glycosyltransferase family 4 protein [Heyndrickxia coagulans]
MNVVINAVLYHERPRGVGRYLNNLLKKMSEIDKENSFYIYYAPWMSKYEFLKIRSKNFHFICLKRIPRNKILRNFYQTFLFPLIILKNKPDVLHIPDTSPILFTTCKTVSTIHDLAEFHFPEKYSKLQSFVRKLTVKLQSRMSHSIITISSYSKKDLINILGLNPNKIKVILNGVDTERFSFKRNFLSTLNLTRQNYILYVGELERSKNVPVLLKAYSALDKKTKKKYSLVLAGRKGNDLETIEKIINKNNLDDSVIILDYVTDDELISLYKGSKCFVFPSLFEGFGLPLLEAMSCGSLVLSSNSSSLPEVGGDCVLYFDPSSPRDLKLKLEEIIEMDEELVNNYKKKGIERASKFTWDECARKTLNCYTELNTSKKTY